MRDNRTNYAPDDRLTERVVFTISPPQATRLDRMAREAGHRTRHSFAKSIVLAALERQTQPPACTSQPGKSSSP
jgi:hypothetical protein